VSKKIKSKSGLYAALAGLLIFTGLMVYALNRDANYVPSQLVGKSVPLFAASTAQGSQFDLQSMLGQGRWIVINFWNTTCVVCRVEAPELERFWRENASKQGNEPFFVSVNIQDEIPDILRYQREFGLSFPVVADRAGKISLDYGVYGTPETFFIDPKGIVRHRVAGEVDRNTILAFVDWLEKNPAVSPLQAIEGFGQVRANSATGG
jgi:cytochrome c biogenesis protein CcmG/thiol:disulfide interchange protein DsbE